MKNYTFISLLIFALNLNAKDTFQTLYQSDLPRKAFHIEYDDSGKIVELITSQWNDRIKTEDGGKAYVKYEQGYNYHKKQGFFKKYDNAGKLISEKWDKSIDGGVAQEEVLIAFDLFKNNDVVKSQFATNDEDIMIYGGFNFVDETECAPGNRCVHVFATTFSRTILSHSVVRLTDSKVVYPIFDKEKDKERNLKLTNIITK
ncbi:MAG: hypothetical protein AB8B80_15270 [Marinicellaceae bacterium]